MTGNAGQEQVEQGRDTRGRFQKGRSGNPRGMRAGTRHKASMLVEKLLLVEIEEIVGAIIAEARAGNVQAGLGLLRLIVPSIRDRLKLPELKTSADAQAAIAQIAAALSAGLVDSDTASTLSNLIVAFQGAADVAELEGRVAALENREDK